MTSTFTAADADLEALISAGIQAQEHLDTGRWRLGALVTQVVTRYGKGTMESYASAVKVERTRLYEYRQVYAFYAPEFSADAEFSERYPALTYSHARAAVRLKDLGAALTFLDECADEALSVEAARVRLLERLGKPVPPRKVMECEGTFEELSRALNAIAQFAKRRYRMVIYEANDE